MACVPLDVVDLILDEVHPIPSLAIRTRDWVTAKETFDACTLVCRNWKGMASGHLFREVSYSFTYDLSTLHEMRRHPFCISHRWAYIQLPGSDTWCPVKTLEEFHDFITVHPAAGSSIKHLCLEGFPLRTGDNSGQKIDSHLLASLIRSLPCLQELSLIDLAVSPAPSPVGTNSNSPLIIKSLRSLDVYFHTDTAFTSFRKLYQLEALQLLACFGAIDRLRIGIPDTGIDTPSHFPIYLRPQTLILHGLDSYADSARFIELISQLPEVIGSIRRLHVDCQWNYGLLDRVLLLFQPMAEGIQEFIVSVSQLHQLEGERPGSCRKMRRI